MTGHLVSNHLRKMFTIMISEFKGRVRRFFGKPKKNDVF